jgi:predicted ATP-binding protein involved in virulence
MEISTQRLRNFRGFERIDIAFDKRLTVLVGVNGAGKSSVLDALAVALSTVAAGIRSNPTHGRRLRESDVRAGVGTCSVALDARIGGHAVTWSAVATRPGWPREAPSNFTQLRVVTDEARAAIERGTDVRLPLAVYYPVNRAVQSIPTRIRTKHEFGALAAYDGALDGAATNFKLFFEWFREREDVENERKARSKTRPIFTDAQLDAVRRAIERFMPDFSDLRIERAPQRMLVTKRGVPFTIEQLSDGEKCSLTLVGDLARRLVLANPGAKDALAAPAVVMIDEIDLHLHPRWQRSALERLLHAFPACQFIVTTHSPQVLAAVPRESIRLLADFKVALPAVETLGRDSNAILSQVMDDSTRPTKTLAQITAIGQALDQSDFAHARSLLDQLATTVSEQDGEVVRLRTLLHFLDSDDEAGADATHQQGH